MTVRGRTEAAFTAPASTARLSGEALERVGRIDDAVARIAGLSMINDQDPGTNIIAMRGVTTDRLQQAAVAFVIDGVALADTELFTAPLFDLESIEVLRGPQGALFGKNAAGGAIAVRTRGAVADGGYVRLGAGNGGSREGEAAGSFALGSGWRARVAGQWRAADGWIKNSTLGRTVDAEESRTVRVAAAGTTGPVRLELGAFRMEDDGGAAWASSGDVTGDFGGRLDGAALTDPQGDFEGRAWRRWVQARARGDMAIFGGQAQVSLAHDSYRKRWVEELDYRAGPLTFFGAPLFPAGLQPIAQPTDIDAWTGEARWRAAASGPRRIDLGGFAQYVDRRRTDDFGPLLFGGAPPVYDTESTQLAVFGGIAQDIGPWTLEAQLRFDADDRTQTITNSMTGARLDTRSARFTRLQPRLAASRRLGQDGLVYAAYGEGFRTGGFNPLPGPGAVWSARFVPEATKSLEAGARWRSPAQARTALLAEAGVFAARISDYQNYTFIDGQSVTLTVPEVEVRGAEISLGLEAPLGAGWRWALDLDWGLAEAEIVRHIAPDPLTPGAVRDYSGRRVPNAPAWTAALGGGLDWGHPDQNARIALTLHATGPTYFEIDNALRRPTVVWADAEASVGAGPWRVSLWGKNVTDERWAVSAFGQGMLPLLQGLGPGGPFDTFTINRGRQWGASLTREF